MLLLDDMIFNFKVLVASLFAANLVFIYHIFLLCLFVFIQGMTNMELQFQMAIRDQIIHDQREALSNLWLVLECSGLNHDQILEIAAQQGIMIEEGIMPVVAGRTHIPSTPIPILHKQPILSALSGSKSPALPPFQNGVDATFHEIDKFQNQRRHDSVDTRSSLSIPADDFKSTSESNGGYLEVPDSHLGSHATTMYRGSADMSRSEGVSLGHPNGDVIRSFSSKKHGGPRTLVDNNDNLESLNSTCQEQLPLEDGDGGIASFGFMGPKVLTHFRSRRRPRSIEGRHQRHLAREGYDTTTSSEGSEADTFNNSPLYPQARSRVDRLKEGAQQSLDQESLWVVSTHALIVIFIDLATFLFLVSNYSV
jgi:hypothetical protein